MTAKNHELFDRVNLDTITENILDSLQEPAPAFLMECEKDIEKEIEAYTKHIVQHQPNKGHDTTPIVENYAGKILDSICESNRIYFETGIKMGAVLLLQLIDL